MDEEALKSPPTTTRQEARLVVNKGDGLVGCKK